MVNPQTRKERIDFLTERAISSFDFNGDELESISQVLKVRLSGLALAYTVENRLPREAVFVHSRVKAYRNADTYQSPEYLFSYDIVQEDIYLIFWPGGLSQQASRVCAIERIMPWTNIALCFFRPAPARRW
jgi:hypothetical protein